MPLLLRKVLQLASLLFSNNLLPALSYRSIESRTQLPAAVKGSSFSEA